MSFHPAGGVGIDPGVPAPPPGPGTAPPFVAPPTDKNKRGLWIGLGIGGLVLLLCCVGGIFGIGVLYVSGIEEVKRQATAAVTQYLDAVRDGNYAGARTLYCPSYANQVSTAKLASQARSEGVTSYRLDEPTIATYIDVRAHLQTGAGEVSRLFQMNTADADLCIINIR